jgi:hypothetical protein
MLSLGGVSRPWIRRLDHLICEVPDIEEAMRHFTDELGYPVAWPIGRFWPQGRTSGVALGGLNLEFLQLDHDPPKAARITTLVFEPLDLEAAKRRYDELGVSTEVRDKWEPDPELLRLRGFDESQSREPQLICRNLVPTSPTPFDFFLCDYSPTLKRRLAPSAFPGLPPVTRIELAVPNPVEGWEQANALVGLPEGVQMPTIVIREAPSRIPEVVSIQTAAGPIWQAWEPDLGAA